MAGSSELPLPNPNNGTNNNTGGQWLIHYARFFNFPALQPTCPSLVSLRSRSRNNTSSGTWLSSSSMVSLQLLRQPIDADGFRLVLLVSSQGKIYVSTSVLYFVAADDAVCIDASISPEEHCISKLHFSWPQISCLEATSLRGSRAVFASYGDGRGQVQKFALRFMTSAHAQDFMSSLKTSLNGTGSIGIDNGRFGPELPSTSQFIPSNGLVYSCSTSQEMSNLYPIGNYQPQVQLLQPNYRFVQYVETNPTYDSESRTATAPPSLNTLIPDMNSDIHQEMPKVLDSMDAYCKSYEQDASTDPKFFTMLGNLEMMLMELGGDLSL